MKSNPGSAGQIIISYYYKIIFLLFEIWTTDQTQVLLILSVIYLHQNLWYQQMITSDKTAQFESYKMEFIRPAQRQLSKIQLGRRLVDMSTTTSLALFEVIMVFLIRFRQIPRWHPMSSGSRSFLTKYLYFFIHYNLTLNC